MKRINKKKVIIAIIVLVIFIGIIIGLVVYNSRKQEDMLGKSEEQNVNNQNLLTNSVENNNEIMEQNTKGDEETLENARIKLTVNGNEEIFVNLDDNQASRDFLEMLPLTLTFEDFNSTEKIATLPNELSTEGQPSGYIPKTGDFAYYAPWGNISVFYKDFRYSESLYKLGTIESGAEIFENLDNDFKITIERINYKRGISMSLIINIYYTGENGFS